MPPDSPPSPSSAYNPKLQETLDWMRIELRIKSEVKRNNRNSDCSVELRKRRLLKALESLRDEFQRCSIKFPRLDHEAFMAWNTPQDLQPITIQAWEAFREATPSPINDSDGSWVWDGPSLINTKHAFFGRYIGSEDAAVEFAKLAESSAQTVAEIFPKVLDQNTGFDGWVWLLHSLSMSLSHPLLESDASVWNFEVKGSLRKHVEAVMSKREHRENDGIEFPIHPGVSRLKYNLFTSSQAAIEAILDPDLTFVLHDDAPLFPVSIYERLSAVTVLDPPKSAHDGTPKPLGNIWKKDGNVWHVRFEDGGVVEEGRFSHRIGFLHIHRLLACTGSTIHLSEFEAAKRTGRLKPLGSTISELEMYEGADDSGNGSFGPDENPIDVIDPEGIRRFNARIELLKEEEEIAERQGDGARVWEIQEEHQQILDELQRGMDSQGYLKHLGTRGPVERDRTRVGNARSEVLKVLRSPDGKCPRLADHLEMSINSVGQGFVAYRPSIETKWNTSAH